MSEFKVLRTRKARRLARTRKRIVSAARRPRLSVSRSNRHFYAQIIDDREHKTLAAVSESELTGNDTMSKTQKAVELGKLLAQKAKTANVDAVVFDKGEYRYHGRVKAFADSAREGGLQF